jgi:drug/metabolite transporter (DMT)-like permease
MMLAGLTGLGLWITLVEHRLPGWPSGWTLASASLAAFAMLTFYEAMRRGPVSLVSPLVGAYPAWMVLINLALGLRPGLLVLIAMAVTMAGMALVAHYAATEPDPEEAPNRTWTMLLALLSSIIFAVALSTGQQAVLADGETSVLWWGRAVGALAMVVVVLMGPRPPRFGLPVVSLAGLQGVLDASGLCALYAAGRGLDGALATVASSAFGVVTVVLARIFYRERISTGQGLGIAAVSVGVIALAKLAQ